MSKFCTKCGSPLKDGKCENCDKEKETKVEKEEKTTKKVESKEETVDIESNNAIGADIVAIYKNIIMKPFTTMKSIYDTASAKLAWVLIAISSVIAGLTTYFFTKKAIVGIMQAFISKASSVAAIAGELSDLPTDTLEMTQGINLVEQQISNMFTTIFLTGFISMIVYYVVYALISKVIVGNLFKGKGKVTDYLLVVAGASVLYSLFGVIALVLSFISWKIAAVALILGGMVFFVATLEGYVKLLNAKKEKLCYAFAVTNIVTAIIVSIASGMIIGSMWSNKVNQIANPYGTMPTQHSSIFK